MKEKNPVERFNGKFKAAKKKQKKRTRKLKDKQWILSSVRNRNKKG